MAQDTGTKFLHFRKRGANGVIDARGGLTVAYVSDVLGGVDKFAVAQCSREDNFCKARGRELSANRLRTVAFAQTGFVDEAEFGQHLGDIASKLGYERVYSRKNKPAKKVTAKKAAKKAAKKVATK